MHTYIGLGMYAFAKCTNPLKLMVKSSYKIYFLILHTILIGCFTLVNVNLPSLGVTGGRLDASSSGGFCSRVTNCDIAKGVVQTWYTVSLLMDC